MVTRRRYHLYIGEWMAERGLSDEDVARKVGVDRVTVTRWRHQQHRLNPQKIADLAAALDLQAHELWRPPRPSRPSVDSILREASDDLVQRAAEVAAILIRRQQP